MFNKSSVRSGLFGLLGFRDTDDPDHGDLLSTLTASSSGQYYSDYHPLITFDNLYSIAPNYDGYNYDTFSATATYATGDFAKYADSFGIPSYSPRTAAELKADLTKAITSRELCLVEIPIQPRVNYELSQKLERDQY